MNRPDDSIKHRAPYDPVKAHEYYLRTRKLKGRKKGSTYTVNYGGGRTVKLTSKELNEQKAYANKRVAEIKNKLNELNSKLREAMRSATKKKATSKREASKPPSAADKSKAARESEKYRDKHRGELAMKRKRDSATKKKTESKSSNDPVAELTDKIVKLRHTLKAVVERQRALAGATKN